MRELVCYTCTSKSVFMCGTCRYIYKSQLVDELRKLKDERIYLSEDNRHKTGATPKLNGDDIRLIKQLYAENPKDNSYSILAKRFGVSRSTIGNALKK